MPAEALFELCVEGVEAAVVADRGGASRIELCTRLDLGGLTPPLDLTRAVLQAIRIPVFVLIRPRGGDFVYTNQEFALMRQQIEECKAAGVAGVVLGVLLADGRIDVARSRELVELAHPMAVTYNRAFDHSPDLGRALEDVIATGADFLLTSGGEANVLVGASSLGRLHQQAGGRLRLLAGGGLKLSNLSEVMQKSGLTAFHGSLKRTAAVAHRPAEAVDEAPGSLTAELNAAQAAALKEDLATAIHKIHQHFAKP